MNATVSKCPAKTLKNSGGDLEKVGNRKVAIAGMDTCKRWLENGKQNL